MLKLDICYLLESNSTNISFIQSQSSTPPLGIYKYVKLDSHVHTMQQLFSLENYNKTARPRHMQHETRARHLQRHIQSSTHYNCIEVSYLVLCTLHCKTRQRYYLQGSKDYTLSRCTLSRCKPRQYFMVSIVQPFVALNEFKASSRPRQFCTGANRA